VDSLLRTLGVAGPVADGLLPALAIFLTALLVTASFVPPVRRFAIRSGLADMPNERRLNKEPLPNLGGLAIFSGVIAALVVAAAIKPNLLLDVQVQVLAIVLGGTILLLTGFIDDQFGLPPIFRLLVQVLAALLLVVNGIRIEAFTGYLTGTPFISVSEPLGVLLTVFWVVALTNAVNLMDGVDGLVGGLGFIAASVILAISAQYPTRGAAVLLLAALAGGCLGFLRHNFNPSRIILGDAGAYFIGYTLAAVSILGAAKGAAAASLVAPLLFLAVPIVDTTQVVIRRLRRGVNPMSTPGKDHLHHQLMKSGLSQRRTTLVLWALILSVNVLGMVVQGVRPQVVAVTIVGVIVLLASVALPRVREAHREKAASVGGTEA
jgi:UDP-GlcNAc:undecaprenyl-phosphate GlcNAc-1-phosphate transferase